MLVAERAVPQIAAISAPKRHTLAQILPERPSAALSPLLREGPGAIAAPAVGVAVPALAFKTNVARIRHKTAISVFASVLLLPACVDRAGRAAERRAERKRPRVAVKRRATRV